MGDAVVTHPRLISSGSAETLHRSLDGPQMTCLARYALESQPGWMNLTRGGEDLTTESCAEGALIPQAGRLSISKVLELGDNSDEGQLNSG